MYIDPKVRQVIMTKWKELNLHNTNIPSWVAMDNVMVVARFLHSSKEKQVKIYIKKISTEGSGVIDLDRLYEEKNVFHFFAEHLSYPEEFNFYNKEEVSLPPSHPDRKSTRLNSSHVAISYAV